MYLTLLDLIITKSRTVGYLGLHYYTLHQSQSIIQSLYLADFPILFNVFIFLIFLLFLNTLIPTFFFVFIICIFFLLISNIVIWCFCSCNQVPHLMKCQLLAFYGTYFMQLITYILKEKFIETLKVSTVTLFSLFILYFEATFLLPYLEIL